MKEFDEFRRRIERLADPLGINKMLAAQRQQFERLADPFGLNKMLAAQRQQFERLSDPFGLNKMLAAQRQQFERLSDPFGLSKMLAAQRQQFERLSDPFGLSKMLAAQRQQFERLMPKALEYTVQRSHLTSLDSLFASVQGELGALLGMSSEGSRVLRLVVELPRFGGQILYAASRSDFKFNFNSNSIGLT